MSGEQEKFYAYAVVDSSQGGKPLALRLSRLMCRVYIEEKKLEGKVVDALRVRRAKVTLFGS